MTPGALAITAVELRREVRAFYMLPYYLYRGDPRWVAPLRGQERRRWLPRFNPSLRTRWVRQFLATRNGRPVGRIAAIVDPAFAARWGTGVGLFGFFECAEDPEACQGLMEAAETALLARSVTRLLGPVNLTTNDEVGLLVDGFDSPPTILSPYNPPYYEALLRHAGLMPVVSYYAYAWSPANPQTPAVERILRLARSRPSAARVSIRAVDPKRWLTELHTLHGLYNASFADLWGFVPLEWEELEERALRFRPFYRPQLVLFAECDGHAIGFALALPDVNQALAGLDGRLWPLGWLQLARRIPRIRAARLLLLGVLPSFRGRGIAVELAAAMADAGKRLGIMRGELSLVQGTNDRMRAVIEALGGVRSKTYRLYEKPLVQPQ